MCHHVFMYVYVCMYKGLLILASSCSTRPSLDRQVDILSQHLSDTSGRPDRHTLLNENSNQLPANTEACK